MSNEYGNITYADTSRREDLTDLIANITPVDTPFTSGMPSKKATGTYHEWQQDTLAARASNAQIEGLGPTYQLITNPSRVGNATQIIKKDGYVSETNRAVDHAGFTDKLAYEMTKKSKEWKNDLEYSAILSTIGTGASGTARTMKGALSFITSVSTALQSASLSETIYNDLLQISWGYGGGIDEVYVGGWLKRKISNFTAGSTKNIESKDRRLVNAVDVYESDYGIQKIFLSRELNSTGASTAKILMVDSKYWALAYLRNPKQSIVPYNGGDYTAFTIIGEVTIECQAQDANAQATGLHNSA
jgi:hypothetical protein